MTFVTLHLGHQKGDYSGILRSARLANDLSELHSESRCAVSVLRP